MKQNLSDPQHFISDKRRKYEITAVLLMGIGKIIFMDISQWQLPFIAIAIIGWTIYVINQSKRVKGILAYWGFRTDNFGTVARKLLPFGVIAIAIFFIIGYQRHSINFSWHIIPILILYPAWGTIQQFLVVGLVAGNLQHLKVNRTSEAFIITITAVLFALVHYPDYWLIAGTFVLALLYTYIYLRHRNVYVLGLFHGWLGGLFYYTIVGRDPFAEVFGRFQ
ncbi:CPBP family intramembrane glutamic endopeptidase [Ohtaekwangia kribbensis]|jgi:membrane protease YdiL (CAAX protease family)|uniref:CPBP family intramembrane glutamic endopeptidase n=1 Tax=Ohtaekwangia kribbensis TaxID=688913 RepID=A0ABW3K7E9_9BACT